MVFKYWFEGLVVVLLFIVMVGLPCTLVAIFGSKMINDLGNFPTKTPGIQVQGAWIFVVEALFLIAAVGVYRLLR